MSIKYHDNINGVQYGADHKLTDNWNPNGDYKDNEYIEVYYRIKTMGYKYMSFHNEIDRENFFNEVIDLFEKLNWITVQGNTSGTCPIVTNVKSHLYCHPQEISGEIKKNEVGIIAKLLEKNYTFSLEWVDLYNEVYDITDEEYTEYLNTQKDKIKNLLLSYCRTTRKNLFMNCFSIVNNIADKVRLHRINDKDGYYGERGFTANYINTVVDELIKQGCLVLAHRNDVKLIRTINKTEQKRLKLFINT